MNDLRVFFSWNNVVEISVIVPCFNEAENVLPLVKELTETLCLLGRPFEILYVDDGSTDETPARLAGAAELYPELRFIRHKRNFGQSAAFMTGFQNTTGDIIITLDADMQNDPHDIPGLLEELKSCDMVCGIRLKRHDTFIRRISARIANWVRDMFLKDGIRDAGCAYRAFYRRVLVQLIAFRGLHRFLPTLCIIHGFKVHQVEVNHRPRISGTSKYGIGNRLFVGIHDLFAMRWYRKRHFSPRRTESHDGY